MGTGDHQDRRVPLLACVAGPAVGVLPLDRLPVDRARPAPIALALWVGLVSQFLPVVGTYLAGILPILLTFLDSPLKAAIVLGFIVIYQQVENYFFAPRITARTMELHPATAFGAALAGAALLGPVGAVLALPAAAMMQAFASEWGRRYDVIDSHLTNVPPSRRDLPPREQGPPRSATVDRLRPAGRDVSRSGA